MQEPNERLPETKSSVKMTDAAQFGTRPISAVRNGWNTLPFRSSREMLSSPTKWIARPSSRLTSRMKRKISTVCRSAEASTLWCSQSQSAQSSSNGFSFRGFIKRRMQKSTSSPTAIADRSLISSIGQM